MHGWIKLWRSFCEGPIWTRLPHASARLAIALLVRADRKRIRWRDRWLRPGSLVTTAKEMCSFCGITRQQYRDALTRLREVGFIEVQGTNRDTAITLVNWGTYQGTAEDENQPRTKKEPAKEPIEEPTPNMREAQQIQAVEQPQHAAKNQQKNQQENRKRTTLQEERSSHHQQSVHSVEVASEKRRSLDDEESEPAADAEARIHTLLRDRHNGKVDSHEFLEYAHAKLDQYGIGLTEFLALDAKKTTRPAGLKNPAGHYRNLVDQLVHQEWAKLRGAGTRLTVGILALEHAERKRRKVPEAVPVCEHCGCASGKGLVLVDGQVAACPACAAASARTAPVPIDERAPHPEVPQIGVPEPTSEAAAPETRPDGACATCGGSGVLQGPTAELGIRLCDCPAAAAWRERIAGHLTRQQLSTQEAVRGLQ